MARCEHSLRGLADRVKVPGRQDRNANIFQLVGNWLQDERIGKWILVLDNVDDDELLRKTGTERHCSSTQPPLRYLLESSNGSIIVTSRNKGVALDIVSHKNVIELLPMTKAEALDLLHKKLNEPAECEDMVQLAEALEFMPLAIIQAAAYITHYSPRCSVSQYLEKIRKSDRDAVRLLNYEAGLLYRDWEAKNSILLTWQISFDHIQDTRPSAAGLLSLMSFFDRQGIPESILRRQRSQETNTEMIEDSSSEEEGDSVADLSFEDDVVTLSDYSLISVGEQMKTFTMHRLVQLTVRVWLRTYGQLEQWKGIFINNLYCEFPTGNYENWGKCRSLFPHVKSAVSQRPESQTSLQQWATLLYKGAWYARESGNISESREMASRSRKQRLKLYGAEDERTLDSAAMLAVAYQLEGRWEEAEQLEVQVMEISKTKLGADYPDTLSSIANLAANFCNQGRWEEAEQLQVQVMETSMITLGEDHPFTLLNIANLASTYRNQGRWKETAQLEVLVMETRKTQLGVDHPDTLLSMANLAGTFWKQGQWEQAEQLQVQVMETRKTQLGGDHLGTLTSMANLAATFWSQGRWAEAEQLQVQVMETRKTTLGKDHPDTLMSMANLASTYKKQGRWELAERFEVLVIETSKTKLGEDHPDTLTSIANLAVTLWNQGRWKEAEKIEVQVMETRKTKLGADHPDTLTSMANLASTYWNQSRFGEAEQLFVQVVETSKTKLGEDHPSTLTSMTNLAFTWKSIGRNANAIDLLRGCVAKQQRVIGPDHPETLANSNALLEWETAALNIRA